MICRASLLIWIVWLGLTACQAANDPMAEMRQSLAELTPLTGNAYVQKRDVFIDQYQTQLQSDATQQKLDELKPLTMDEQVVLLILQTRVLQPELFNTVHNYLEDNIPDQADKVRRLQFHRLILQAEYYFYADFGFSDDPYYIVAWEYLWKEDQLHTYFKESIIVRTLVGARITNHPLEAEYVLKQLLTHTNDMVVTSARFLLMQWFNYDPD